MTETPACSAPGRYSRQKETLDHEGDAIESSGSRHPAESVGRRESRKGEPMGWTEREVGEAYDC